MVAQRTALMSLSFFSILIARNPPNNDINLLWTGATAPYSDIRMGLICVVAMYLISYVWKWFTDNNQDFHNQATRVDDIDITLDHIIENWEKYISTSLDEKTPDDETLDAYKESFHSAYNQIIQMFTTLKDGYQIRGIWALWHHRVFTLVLPVIFPIWALYSLI